MHLERDLVRSPRLANFNEDPLNPRQSGGSPSKCLEEQ